jgi:hypothetical protein
MNNRTQQRFDRSIADAIDEGRRAQRARPARPVSTVVQEAVAREVSAERTLGRRRGYRLYLHPVTGATVYGPWPPAEAAK